MDSTTIDRGLQTLLRGDATLIALVGTRAFNRPTPPFKSLPMIAWLGTPDSGLGTLGDTHAIRFFEYRVEAIGAPSEPIALEPIANRLFALLNQQSFSWGGLNVRFDPIKAISELSTTGNALTFGHLGTIYRVTVRS